MRKYLFLCASLAALAGPAWAQDGQENEGEDYTGPISTGGGYRLPETAITVTATGTQFPAVFRTPSPRSVTVPCRPASTMAAASS